MMQYQDQLRETSINKYFNPKGKRWGWTTRKDPKIILKKISTSCDLMLLLIGLEHHKKHP